MFQGFGKQINNDSTKHWPNSTRIGLGITITVLTMLLLSCKSEQQKLDTLRQSAKKEIGSEIFPLTKHLKTNGLQFIAGMFLIDNYEIVNAYWSKPLSLDLLYNEIIPKYEVSITTKDKIIFPVIIVSGASTSKDGQHNLEVGLKIYNSAMMYSEKIQPLHSKRIIRGNSDDFIIVGPMPGITVEDDFQKGGKLIFEATVTDKFESRRIKLKQEVKITTD